MANKTVSNLKETTTVSNSDVLLVETATETLKVTKENLLKEVNQQLNAKSDENHTHDEYVTENELNSKGLATETFVTNKIAEASLNGGDVDLSGYATKEELSNKSDKTHNHSYNDLTDKPTIPSLDGYATESFVTQKIAEASFGDTEGSPIVLIEPSDNDVPKLFFTGTFPTTKDSTTMEFEYVSKTKRFKGYVDIKCQGTTSMGFPKKNFTIKLYEDEEKTIKMTQNFKKWGEQTKFCLKANYVDTTHTRNISGARVAYDMIESRPDSEFKTYLATSPRNGVIDGFPIKVFNNGMFHGIYTLNIPKDEWMFGMDKDNPNHMVLCAEENNNGNMSANGTCQFRALWTNSNNSHWSVEVGTLTDEMRNSFNNAIRHVMNTTDEQFVADMDKYFDVDSLVDYFCFSYFMCHLDGLAKNMLMVTYDGVHWGASLYDMDTIYGAWYDGTRFVAHDYKCPEQYQENNSLLWQRLSKNFSQKIQDRYFELRKGALSLGNVVSHVENIYDLLSDRDLTEERNKWTGLPSVNTNTIPRFREYMRDRSVYVDAEITDLVADHSVNGLTLSQSTITVQKGNKRTLTATLTPINADNKNVLWTTDDTNGTYVTISPDGLSCTVTGVSAGVTTVTCTSEDTTNGVISDSCVIAINESSSESDALYTLSDQVIDTTSCIDTNIDLFDATSSELTWSIFMDIDADPNFWQPYNNHIIHSAYENAPYPGIGIMPSSGVNNIQLDFCGAKHEKRLFGATGVQNLKFVFNIDLKANQKSFFKFLTNEGVIDTMTLTHTGKLPNAGQTTLVIGGYKLTDGTYGRYTPMTVNNFKLYDRLLTEEEAEALLNS